MSISSLDSSSPTQTSPRFFLPYLTTGSQTLTRSAPSRRQHVENIDSYFRHKSSKGRTGFERPDEYSAETKSPSTKESYDLKPKRRHEYLQGFRTLNEYSVETKGSSATKLYVRAKMVPTSETYDLKPKRREDHVSMCGLQRPFISRDIHLSQTQDLLPRRIHEKSFAYSKQPLGPIKRMTKETREYFYKSKSFQHFHYALNLVRDCASRVEPVLPSLIKETQLPNDVMVKIRFTGQVSEDNLKLVTKRKGKKKMTENQTIWETSPLIYFQNEDSLESSISNLIAHDGNHKILVTSNTTCTNDKAKYNIVIVDADHVQEAIALCLEEPLHRILDKWSKGLKTLFQSEQIVHITSEIVNICKQMMFDETKVIPTLVSTSTKIPTNLKEFLLSHDDVTSFGLWENSCFKVFVKNETNKHILFNWMRSMNEDFFKKYDLQIENKRIVGKLTMKQGDFLVKNPPDIEESFDAGTLGGFVTEPNNLERKYALTSGHLFPEESQFAYAGASLKFKQIGKCVFTTADSQCDTAVIEIDESVANDCDIIFRREDGKKTNAHVYDGNLDQLGILHKKGAGSGVTKGTMLSEEFYLKNLIDDDNRDSVFFVRGTGDAFLVKATVAR